MNSCKKYKHNCWTKKELVEAVKNSYSITEVLRKLNCAETAEYYRIRAKNDIEQYNIDISHFDRYRHAKTNMLLGKATLQEQIDKGWINIANDCTKKRLIQIGYFENKCFKCEISDWQGEPLSLHMDHIDGDRKNNSIDNLRLLCPNCHSQTHTYGGKNVKKKSKNYEDPRWACLDCKEIRQVKNIPKKQGRCQECNKKHLSKINQGWNQHRKGVLEKPSKEELKELIQIYPWTILGEVYGVSDNAVRKWAKGYGLPTNRQKRKKNP